VRNVIARLPVIIGIGEIVDRPDDPVQSLEPLALMTEALRRANQDAGSNVLDAIDSLDIVHQVSWRYEKTAARLCDRAGIAPARAVYGVTGGESPMRYLHEAALRIVRGESDIAAVVGAEAQYAVNKAKAAGIELPWTPIAKDVENPFPIGGRLNPVAIAHGAIRPIQVYPFYENASHVAWGQTPRQALAESGELWSRYSTVAAANPYSWSKKRFTASEIATSTRDNRLIAYPYTKHMVANPAVNQGAAIILTTLERAREMKIDESRLIFIWGGASAMEPRDYLTRDQYARSDAQDVVLHATRELAYKHGSELGATELYSCFPCVPKMTRRVLGLGEDTVPTVTGGLSFFGAPLNNYMTHAACAMVRHLREGRAESGLLYGQGEFVTKHHSLFVSRSAPKAAMNASYSVQSEVDRRRGPVPILLTEYQGPAKIETHTVIYDRDGSPLHGIVIARAKSNERIMARVPATDTAAIATLIDGAQSPIERSGHVTLSEGGLLRWEF
jgi:acetyl-CoA C-acetyltransferase